MKFVCFSDWDQLPESANALFTHAENDSIFFSRPWFESVASVTLNDNQNDEQAMLLACVVAESKVMAILPLIKCKGKTWYSLKHRYTPIYSLLITDEDQQHVLSCLAQGLSQLPLDGFLLEPVANNDNNLAGFHRAMESAGFNCNYNFRHYNWIYRVQGQSYDDYIAARPAKLRNTILRKKRKLEREQGYDISLFTGDDVPQAMSDYYAVYTASWKANELNVDFITKFLTPFSRAGWSRLAILYIKGKPAAAQLWFVHHGKASIFRLAYDEMWKQYSPGSILTSFLMQYVIDTDKVEEIDFLTGNDSYKQDWMSERRERFLLSCVRTSRPAAWYEQFINALKRILKK